MNMPAVSIITRRMHEPSKTLRDRLAHKGVPYVERNIDLVHPVEREAILRELKRSGHSDAPVVNYVNEKNERVSFYSLDQAGIDEVARLYGVAA